MASSDLLYSQYPFLKELGIEETNQGVYDGTWFASGEEYTTVSPTNNKPIAKIRAVSVSFISKMLPLCVILKIA